MHRVIKVGDSKWAADLDSQEDTTYAEQYLNEMADELIDYMLALQDIAWLGMPGLPDMLAQSVLRKYGKLEGEP